MGDVLRGLLTSESRAKIVAENRAEKPEIFCKQVNMWVYEETIGDRNLTEIINTDHENDKYLPDVKLSVNLVANPSILATAEDANLLIFNIPHQFLPRICRQLEGKVSSSIRGISCLKGLEVNEKNCKLLSQSITDPSKSTVVRCQVLTSLTR